MPGIPITRLLTTGEVAALLRVDSKTVGRWVRDGQLTAIRTLGGSRGRGHLRFREADIKALVAGLDPHPPEEE